MEDLNLEEILAIMGLIIIAWHALAMSIASLSGALAP